MARGLADFDPAALSSLRTNYIGEDGVGRGLTAEQLAVMVGATKAQVLAYENGRQVPDPERIQALADALGVRPRRLMDRSRAHLWSVADLRRGCGFTAQRLVEELGISPKSYRRFEQQAIVPARRPRFLDDVAGCLGVRLPALELAIDNIPAVAQRSQRAAELTAMLAAHYVSRSGLWKGPAAEDVELLELAALYGRPPQRLRRVMTHQLGELRHMMVRIKREQVIAEYDPDLPRQQKASSAVERWEEMYERELGAIPLRLEEFHRTSQPSDAWQVLVDLHDADAWPDGSWVPSALLARTDTLTLLPPSLVTQRLFDDVPAAQLTRRGLNHLRKFRGLYAALFPGIRSPRRLSNRSSRETAGAARSPAPPPELSIQLPGRSERFAIPPLTVSKLVRQSEAKGVTDTRLSPTVVMRIGTQRPAATVDSEELTDSESP
ncbi:helix-turn-helix domain-containing protein [Streptomyces malaysiensis]|uniref:helix-turn-helix domain-containing protein n=1 Tax=Streptomyces malaysiensis TaxID=92644 RepID=UPI00142EC307|nr:helix-turn-helix transcriptional regulator [Streptomyces malaysiensis]